MTSPVCPADETPFVGEEAPSQAQDNDSALGFFTRSAPTTVDPLTSAAGRPRPGIGASTSKIGSSLFSPGSLPPVGVDATVPQMAAQPVAAPAAPAEPNPADAADFDGDPENDPAIRAEAHQLIGSVLGDRYRVEEMIGVGGMGIVFRATHVTIGKPMAIKMLRLRHAQRESIAKRFAQEAQLASRVKHPNVVDIVDYGVTPGGAPYYAMEFLDGHSLAWQVDNRGRIAPLRAIDIAIQIAAGLGEALKLGVIHRDLKPDNIYLCRSSDEDRDLVKLLDFGIARVAGRKTRLTAAGAVVGTPEYMSPEQAQGNEVDPRADLYSLGVILFEMIAGEVPFRADTMVGTLTKQVFEAPPPLRQFAPSLPQLPNLERLLARLLAKNRDERPATAAEVSAALKAARDGDLTANGDVSKPQQRATVAIGSWGVGDQAPTAGSVESPTPGRGPMMSPPNNAGWGGSEAPPKRPSVIVRDGTPSEFVPAHQRSHGRQARSVLPVVLLGSGAAVFAALLTVGLVRYVDRQSPEQPMIAPIPAAAALVDTAPAPAPTDPGPEPVEQEIGDGGPEMADGMHAEAESEPSGLAGPEKRAKPKSNKKVAKASKPATNETPPVQRPGASKNPESAQKPRDPPPPPSVSLGDLKDPFAEK